MHKNSDAEPGIIAQGYSGCTARAISHTAKKDPVAEEPSGQQTIEGQTDCVLHTALKGM